MSTIDNQKRLAPEVKSIDHGLGLHNLDGWTHRKPAVQVELSP